MNVLQSFVLSAAMSFIFWQSIHPFSVVFALAFLVLAEIGIKLKMRSEFICKKCGFDPVLYKRSPALAKAKVQEFFKVNIMDPEVPLIDSPLIELRKKLKVQETTAKRASFRRDAVLGSPNANGKNLSRSTDL